MSLKSYEIANDADLSIKVLSAVYLEDRSDVLLLVVFKNILSTCVIPGDLGFITAYLYVLAKLTKLHLLHPAQCVRKHVSFILSANELCNLLHGLNVYVNLIPYNEVIEKPYKRSTKEAMVQFFDLLKKRRINVQLRKEQGSDIDAACGQLRSKHLKK